MGNIVSENKRELILQLLAKGSHPKQVAKKALVSLGTVYNVRNGQTYSSKPLKINGVGANKKKILSIIAKNKGLTRDYWLRMELDHLILMTPDHLKIEKDHSI